MANEKGWRRCRKCQGLFLTENSRGMLLGTCPASQKYGGLILHDGTQSPPYVMRLGEGDPNAHMGCWWRLCRKCKGLFFAKDPNLGACPASGKHDAKDSPVYSLRFGDGVAGMESGWRYCQRCRGLFCGLLDPGVCPAGGKHDGTQSYDFFMRFDNPSPPKDRVFDLPSLVFDGSVPISGSSRLTIRDDGSWSIQSHFHDSGALEYNLSWLWSVKDCWNQLYTFPPASGHVAGTFESGPRDLDLPQNDTDRQLALNWSDLSPGASADFRGGANVDLVNLTNTLVGAAGLVLAVIALGAGGAAAAAPAAAAAAAH